MPGTHPFLAYRSLRLLCSAAWRSLRPGRSSAVGAIAETVDPNCPASAPLYATSGCEVRHNFHAYCAIGDRDHSTIAFTLSRVSRAAEIANDVGSSGLVLPLSESQAGHTTLGAPTAPSARPRTRADRPGIRLMRAAIRAADSRMMVSALRAGRPGVSRILVRLMESATNTKPANAEAAPAAAPKKPCHCSGLMFPPRSEIG